MKHVHEHIWLNGLFVSLHCWIFVSGQFAAQVNSLWVPWSTHFHSQNWACIHIVLWYMLIVVNVECNYYACPISQILVPMSSYCLLHKGLRDKRRVSGIDLSQPRHETAFWWRHNGPVTSQLTDPVKWPVYPLQLVGISVHINTHNKESLTHRCRRSTNVQLCLIFLYISIWFES